MKKVFGFLWSLIKLAYFVISFLLSFCFVAAVLGGEKYKKDTGKDVWAGVVEGWDAVCNKRDVETDSFKMGFH